MILFKKYFVCLHIAAMYFSNPSSVILSLVQVCKFDTEVTAIKMLYLMKEVFIIIYTSR